MNHAAPEDQPGGVHRPPVVTLCGSTRFKNQINAENARLTLQGNLVISLGVFGHTDMPDVDWTTDGSDIKRMLDDLHLRKIDLADRVHVINPGGYIGESTRSEIDYARRTGKPITYLHDPAALPAVPTCGQPPTAGKTGRAAARAANRAAWAAGDSGAEQAPSTEPGHQATGVPAEGTAQIAAQRGSDKGAVPAAVIQAIAQGTQVVVVQDPKATPRRPDQHAASPDEGHDHDRSGAH